MANKKFWLGMLIAVLAFGITVVGCSAGGGTFTLTNIPSKYDGKYAVLMGSNFPLGFWGGEKNDGRRLKKSRISDGKVTLPMWFINYDDIDPDTVPIFTRRYSGDHSADSLFIHIYDSGAAEAKIVDSILFGKFTGRYGIVSTPKVTFLNGSAIKSWNDGESRNDGESQKW